MSTRRRRSRRRTGWPPPPVVPDPPPSVAAYVAALAYAPPDVPCAACRPGAPCAGHDVTDDGVRDRSTDPGVLAALVRVLLRRVAHDARDPSAPATPPDPSSELRLTLADLLAATREHDLRVTVAYGLAGPGHDLVTARLTPRPTEPITDPPTEES